MKQDGRQLKEELWRTFALYALVPIFVVAVLGVILAAVYWNLSIQQQTREKLEQTCTRLEEMVRLGKIAAEKAAADCPMDELTTDKDVQAKLYEKMYRLAALLGKQTAFYVFDEQGRLLLTSTGHPPVGISSGQGTDWGFLRQLKQNPAEAVFDFLEMGSATASYSDMVMGHAVLQQGRVRGYVVFLLSPEELQEIFSNPRVHFGVKDRYDNAVLYTDPFFVNGMNKSKAVFDKAGGYLAAEGREYYTDKKILPEGALTVYALTPVGGLVQQLIRAVLLLSGVLLILLLTIWFTVKRQVESKTRMLDVLVAAFAAVKQGNFSQRLDTRGNTDFRTISEAYNLMLDSLQELLRSRQERARATVISEIKQLESQFHPHFLFNTLENIKFMIALDQAAAGKMILALSRLLRYSIHQDEGEVTLQEDLAYTRNYLEIQKYRFGDRLEHILHVDQTLLNAVIPRLVLQPVIENSIKYGFQRAACLRIYVNIGSQDETLELVVNDDGPGMTRQALAELRSCLQRTDRGHEHSGLYNIHRRIQLLYGHAYGLQVDSREGEGTTVVIRLPVKIKTGREEEKT